MAYVQISTVAWGDLSKDEVEFLEMADTEKFVDVVGGDESRPLNIVQEELTLEEVLEEAVYGDRIVFWDKKEKAPNGFIEVKSYYPGEWTLEKISD